MTHDARKIELLEAILAAELVEVSLLQEIVSLLSPPVPATIVFTNSQGAKVSSVSLTGTQTVDVAVAVGDINGDVISGDVLDAGATVTVDDGTVCTATLSADQTTVTVAALDTNGTTNVTVNGTSGGVALTDFDGPLVVTTTASAAVPATIVLTPGTPQGS